MKNRSKKMAQPDSNTGAYTRRKFIAAAGAATTAIAMAPTLLADEVPTNSVRQCALTESARLMRSRYGFQTAR